MKINSKKYFIKTKLRLCILILMIIGIIVYNILLQKRVINFNETIYPIIGIYISLLCLWGVLELNIKFPISYDINKNNNQTKKSVKMYKTNFGDDTITKISDGICNNQNDIPEIFCVNCHRRIYSSNYTGTNMCSECKKYYYSEVKNEK